jgi:hypothetical protein
VVQSQQNAHFSDSGSISKAGYRSFPRFAAFAVLRICTRPRRLTPATKLPAFYFAGRPIPPTIRLHPGDTLVLDYTNALSTSSGPPLDMTNMHTHGLLDSPQQPGDEVLLTMVMPQQTYRPSP